MSGAVVPEERGSDRVEFIDLLRVLSAVAVVFVHSYVVTKHSMAQLGSPVWHFGNVFNSVAVAGVPLFFMISGAVLIGSEKTLSIGHTLKRRLPRLLVPLVAWSLIYIAYKLGTGWQRTGEADWSGAIFDLKHIPDRPVDGAFWFMYVIIPLYILSPLIKRLVDSLSRTLAIYLVALWALIACLLPTIDGFFHGPSGDAAFVLDLNSLSVAPLYLGYFIVGYYLTKLRRPLAKKWLAAFIVVDAATITLGTWWRTADLGVYDKAFVGYQNIFTVAMSCAVFLLCKECLRGRRLGRRTGKVVGVLAPLTFGVYLVHPLVIGLLTDWQPLFSVRYLVAYFGAALLASLACAVLLSLIKPLCWVLLGRRYTRWWRRAGREGGAGGCSAGDGTSPMALPVDSIRSDRDAPTEPRSGG